MGESLITVFDVALYCSVKPSTVYAWVHFRKIPFYKVGKKTLRFKLSEIEAWMVSRENSVQEASVLMRKTILEKIVIPFCLGRRSIRRLK